MARIKAADYEEKQQDILDAAAKLFAQNGYPHSSLTAIARKCRASKSKLYHYFGSKKDILFQLLHEYCLFTIENFAGIDANLPAEERLRRFVQIYIERPPKMRHRHIVLVNDLKYLPERDRRQIVTLERRMLDNVVLLLREMKHSSDADEKVLRTYVLLLFGTINGIDSWFNPSGFMTPAELSQRVAKLFLHGFSNGPRR
jgi:AcrR family transcriptional regulator